MWPTNLKRFSAIFGLVLAVVITPHNWNDTPQISGQVVDGNGEPIAGAIVTLQYIYHLKILLPLEHGGGGWAWATVVKTDVDGFYQIPVMPEEAVPGWRNSVGVVSDVYVKPTIEKADRELRMLTVFEEDETESIGSSAKYGKQPTPLVVGQKTVDLTNEEQLKARIDYVYDVFSAAPNAITDSLYRPYRWSDKSSVMKAMREEMELLCSYWKPEYHSPGWPSERTELPLDCHYVLGTGRERGQHNDQILGWDLSYRRVFERAAVPSDDIMAEYFNASAHGKNEDYHQTYPIQLVEALAKDNPTEAILTDFIGLEGYYMIRRSELEFRTHEGITWLEYRSPGQNLVQKSYGEDYFKNKLELLWSWTESMPSKKTAMKLPEGSSYAGYVGVLSLYRHGESRQVLLTEADILDVKGSNPTLTWPDGQLYKHIANNSKEVWKCGPGCARGKDIPL